jgi:putative molybdopterin biosynthesis protein
MTACANAGWLAGPAAERVPLSDGLGRVTTAPVHALRPAPRFACAAMDGIAIGSASIPCPGEAVGEWRVAVSAYAWVDTGDLVPAGFDTVVERERVRAGADGSVWVTGPVPPGQHVRAAGEDFDAGQPLIGAGHRLRPADLATAAAAGYAELAVARRPVAAIIPTGDEIRPVGAALRPGDVTDSNSLLLATRAVEIGAAPVVSAIAPDDPAAIIAEIRRAAPAAGIVLVIAGSSAGRGDHTAAVLAKAGGLTVQGVAVRPGHPVLLGFARTGPEAGAGQQVTAVPVIGVPGYPLAAAVTFELFAVPVIAALQGLAPREPVRLRARLACDWTSSPEVEDWVPVVLTAQPADPPADEVAVATPSRRGAGATSKLMRADGWWRIPAGQAKFARGEMIDVRPIAGAPH